MRAARLICAAALAFAALWAGPSAARPLTAAEAAGLTEVVARYKAALAGRDAARLSQIIPPRMIARFAKASNVGPEVMRIAIARGMAARLSETEVETVEMSAESAPVRYAADADLHYALVPTRFVLKQKGKRFEVVGQTLALREPEGWYLLRIGRPQQLTALKSAYPALDGLEAPAETRRVLE